MALDSLAYRTFAFRISTEIGTTSNVFFCLYEKHNFQTGKKRKNDAALHTSLVRV